MADPRPWRDPDGGGDAAPEHRSAVKEAVGGGSGSAPVPTKGLLTGESFTNVRNRGALGGTGRPESAAKMSERQHYGLKRHV